MNQRVVYLAGRYVAESEARLSIYDAGVTSGAMAFEVTRTIRLVPFRLEQHLQRLWHSLSVLRIDPGLSAAKLIEITHETLRRNVSTEPADVDWNIVHNISRGPATAFLDAFAPEERQPTIVVSSFPMVAKMAALAPAYEHGLDLVVPAQCSLPGEWFDMSIKTRSRIVYEIANFQAEVRCPGSTPVLVEPAGWLTETTTGNLFLVRDGELCTPTPRSILRGVTRDFVIELAQQCGILVREGNFTVHDATTAEEMFITSTSVGILHARSMEGVTLGDGRIGPLTARLRAAFDDAVGLSFAEQAREYSRRVAR